MTAPQRTGRRQAAPAHEPLDGPGETTAAPRRTVLMNPGPVVADERVRAALGGPDLCHREPEFTELMSRVRDRVTRICGGGDEHTALILTGSGTSAVEAALTSVVPADGALLTLDNGHYGRRMHDIAVAHGLRSHRLDFGWTVPLDLDAVDRALAADPGLSHVAVVHHETSTGMLNDLAAVTRVAHRHGREVVVDAVSSVGAEDIDLVRDGIDWLAGSANKCLEGMPGLAFVTGRRAAFAALAGHPRRSYYLDLARHFTAQETSGAPAFTPAVPTFYAFDTALRLALREGVPARRDRYRALVRLLRDGLERLGFTLLLPPEHRAVGLTVVRLPPGVSYDALHAPLKAAGYVIYAAQGPLAEGHFRLSTLGALTTEDITGFLDALARTPAVASTFEQGGTSR
ncbi:aminotransferase class V-fold PLP-dependent enzyme [Streptomyces sp. TRM76323]|uniref:Aminotransferase class V-fold PLP-dependent enzyme n=1 Tax=Streptomyces tamarix TaxID=3078565 RepID=A0ABU3QIS8_9ACTN|nr:aminotransferase class V-fold PLP-dependent enzyme [Streptomyces tamarix]MDT9682408.1 aminotransferase class V-fold PLP-dependent enzyme [Streptomyces tamarix]